ncbi:STAS domain-containing protein [Actinoplanes sp. NPDC048791]|uniref:STAS domain-containing protein n=1 Tax=Actinoplanes sp. NPDC048791 TaxID=3154623 RepID=UPI0033CC982E
MSQPSLISVRPAQGAPTFTLSTVEDGAVTVVRACGELDQDTAPALTEHTDQLVAGRSPLVLVLDLAGVDYLGAAGITALLYVRDAVGRRGGRLVLREPSSQVRKVLQLGQVAGLFAADGTCETSGTHIPPRIG